MIQIETRCRGDPGDEVPAVVLDDSGALDATPGPPSCHTERKPQ